MKTGVTKELEGNIFDLGERSSADLMRTTQIQIDQYVGSIYGGDIMGELQTKKEFVAPLPVYPETAIVRMPDYEAMHNAKQSNTLAKLKKKKTRLQVEIDAIPIVNTTEIETLDERCTTSTTRFSRWNMKWAWRLEFHWMKKKKGYGSNVSGRMEREFQGTSSINKRHLLSSWGNVRRGFKRKCMTILGGMRWIKIRSHLSFTP
jgi:hypothetical protein